MDPQQRASAAQQRLFGITNSIELRRETYLQAVVDNTIVIQSSSCLTWLVCYAVFIS